MTNDKTPAATRVCVNSGAVVNRRSLLLRNLLHGKVITNPLCTYTQNVMPHCESRPHIQAHLVCQTHNPNKTKELEFCQRSTETEMI